jgi:hypothetical protein
MKQAGCIGAVQAGAMLAPTFFGVFVAWAWWVSLLCQLSARGGVCFFRQLLHCLEELRGLPNK